MEASIARSSGSSLRKNDGNRPYSSGGSPNWGDSPATRRMGRSSRLPTFIGGVEPFHARTKERSCQLMSWVRIGY